MNRDRDSLLVTVSELSGVPRTPQVRLALAEAEFRLALLPGTSTPERIERLHRALCHDPYSAKAEFHLGRLLHGTGRLWAALAAYRRAYRLAPGNRRISLLAAISLLDLGKEEREIGAALLVAVARDDAPQIDAAMAQFDVHIERQGGGGEPTGGQAGPRRRRAAPTAELLGRATPPVRQALLHEHLVRKRPPRAWVTAYLDAGAASVESAVAATLLVGCGVPPADIPQTHRDGPAARLLAAALELAEEADPERFVARAAALLDGRWLPPELVLALHFERWGELDVLEGIALLDAYPASVRELDGFRELRIAVLDGPARRAWSEGRPDEAAVLWRAMIRLDPERADTALNLAMHATGSRSPAYRPAWERVAELLYRQAAAAGDLDLRAADRTALHKAHSTQSLRAAGDRRVDDDALERWMADGDAVEVWLREWDLFYLNARLRFRSPSLLLGVGAEAGADELGAARRIMLLHLDAAFVRTDRPDGARFARLARERLDAADGPLIAREQAEFDDLEREALDRALLLRRLLEHLARLSTTRGRRLAGTVLRSLFLLPLPALDRRCAELGLITTDETLTAILDGSAAFVVRAWPAECPDGAEVAAELLADVEPAFRAMTEPVGLTVPYSRLLLWNGRGAEAYALGAKLISRAGSPEVVRDLQSDVLDDAGGAAAAGIPDGDAGLEAARGVLAGYPLSPAARAAVVVRLVRLGGEARLDEAAHLLSSGARQAPTESLRTGLYARIRSLPRAADAAVRRQIRHYRTRAAPDDLAHALAMTQARRFDHEIRELRHEIDRARGAADVHG
ncbi:hypothetical protein OWR29_16645 [Actinoplanes sp. Pm04-4]|uniref:Tetratricopeptide repeat protein n=1 Tax=Paractinoplanes pyxinae TaxID=2997416 RepID=A0ABT4B162_9ACTN|nr:hypothetical protein [Actinoplanes pyxinae]MCY1139630.1 hypothetical protein [Actinoplanes pyxinae]